MDLNNSNTSVSSVQFVTARHCIEERREIRKRDDNEFSVIAGGALTIRWMIVTKINLLLLLYSKGSMCDIQIQQQM